MIKIIPFILFSMLNAQDSISTNLDCDQCHKTGTWLPINSSMQFNHQETFFPLTGQHIGVDCIQCHNGSTIQERHNFSNVKDECQSCHMDIHFGSFGFSCDDCHSTTSWTFNNLWRGHDLTYFPLVGRHKFLSCDQCHISSPETLINSDCFTCHADEYFSALSAGDHPQNTSCEYCHNTQDFSVLDMGRHDALFFPINSGDHKGEWTTCSAECHYVPTDYSIFNCGLNGICHEHEQNEMDDEHSGNNNYKYESNACFSCHPNG